MPVFGQNVRFEETAKVEERYSEEFRTLGRYIAEFRHRQSVLIPPEEEGSGGTCDSLIVQQLLVKAASAKPLFFS